MQEEPVTGIILAGGKSTRFGSNKALFHYRGKPMVEHVIEVLRPLCSKLLLSTNQAGEYRFTGLECIADCYPDRGPLGGIHACLLQSRTEHNLIAGCDLPELDPRLYRLLLQYCSGYQVVVPVHRGLKEPLVSYFNKNTISVIQESLKQNDFKVHRVINRLHTLYLRVENADFYSGKLFTNVNTQGDAGNLNKNE